MAAESDIWVYNVGMIVFLFTSLVIMLISSIFMKSAYKDTLWLLSRNKHISVQARVIDCQVIETMGSSSTAANGGRNANTSVYYPILLVQFELHNQTITSKIVLNDKGFGLPEKAFQEIQKIAPHGKIKFIHTYERTLYPQAAEYMQNFRLQEDATADYTMTLIINPDNPQTNNFNYKSSSYKEWIAPGIIFLVALFFILPVFLVLKELSLQFRIISVICTFTIAVVLFFAIPKLLAFFSIERTTINSKPKFEILIDNNYDGSQIEPYLQKPEIDGN